MCLILLSYQSHSEYPLVLAANRDEFYDRPAAPAEFWKENPDILAGRDIQAGGTWLGVSRKGRIAMITNYREVSRFDPKAPTRGKLVSDFLIGNVPASDYLEDLRPNASAYNGFNLILRDKTGLYYFSNRTEGIVKLTPGKYGLSNHLLDTPWPKVSKSKARFGQLLGQPKIQEDELFEVLTDTMSANDDQLPDTGVGVELERMLSPVFIKNPKYGTRCSTLIYVSKNALLTFVERTHDPLSSATAESRFSFKWEGLL
jgi:uncharacterized protein with NRDE domain